MKSLEWKNDKLVLLDQTKLPGEVVFVECRNYLRVAEAIKKLEVRGAPAIGAAAAYGMVLGGKEASLEGANIAARLRQISEELKATRPTAVNLAWAVDRMMHKVAPYLNQTREEIYRVLEAEAHAIEYEDCSVNERISCYGAELFSNGAIVLTHCNAGALATVAYGTALGVIRKAYEHGHVAGVFADETRPLLQGARLTAWELMQDQIPVTLITDNMAGWVMKNKMVHAVIVGADRIALNGDVANKIGTYSVAVLAKEHGIPVYVAAPVSTFDFSIATGDEIVIEERDAEEVTHIGRQAIAPEGVQVFNPAFDVTPAEYITAIITEYGVLRKPFTESINVLQKKKNIEC